MEKGIQAPMAQGRCTKTSRSRVNLASLQGKPRSRVNLASLHRLPAPYTLNHVTSTPLCSERGVKVGVWCVVCGVWCVVCGVWCAVRGVWWVVCVVWCVVCIVWCVVCGAWCAVCGVWGLGCVVFGVVCGVWCEVCGVVCVGCEVWCVEVGCGAPVPSEKRPSEELPNFKSCHQQRAQPSPEFREELASGTFTAVPRS